ncbi:hypothetical protein P6144_00330 [Sphingomonas sp. HITSZ_GF]|uniref:hypothetical protein n=1 Tax=Sphingomonas sp. HITSZ_GF TaxID=3037247 RepID=UPI00240E2FE0|nr:hypothetical protein [Sphingomonas sp. HITSZ_GF]MDG2532082.1 hypothetical protein [Sphingomonas sp. HITSZ_GF]
MGNQVITADTISVHGRGSLQLPFKLTRNGEQFDLSTLTLAFEVDGIPLIGTVVADPGDPKGILIQLTGDQVAKLTKPGTRFALRNTTVANFPDVLWDGKIKMFGYADDPDATEDA